MTDQHLVIIRGNSASGKTTTAHNLQHAMGRGTANIGQDHFRRVVLREHDVPGGDNIDLIQHTALHCLRLGYHLILEGIFYTGHYGEMLRDLIAHHDGPNHVVYLDVSLGETLRRHAGRPLAAEVPAAKIRKWYLPSDHLRVPGEIVLDESHSATDIVERILARTGPITPRPQHHPARFL